MADDNPRPTNSVRPDDPARADSDDEESVFWERMDAAFERGLDRWIAKHDVEDTPSPARTADKSDRSEPIDKPTRTTPRQEDDDRGTTAQDDEPTEAERRRDAGRRGPNAPSGYWGRAHDILYGRNRRRAT